MLRNKHLKPQTHQVILNVMDYFERERDNEGALAPFGSVMQRTSEACGISLSTLTRIKRGGSQAVNENLPIHSTCRKRNRTKSKSCDVEDFIKDAVKRKIYAMHSKRLHVTAKTLQKELVTASIYNFSLTSLRRLLPKIGFFYKVDDGRRGLFEKQHIAAARIKLLRDYHSNKETQLYEPVFLDETWLFSRGSAKKNWHDNSHESIKKKPFGTGKRFIVIHAGNKNGFIHDASLLFSSKSQYADYHGDMDREMFTKWFQERLLPNLSGPSLIVLDNASYHSQLIEKVPNTSSNKEELIKYLLRHNIFADTSMLKRELLALVKENVQPKIYILDELAAQSGHKVLRLPPYHCQFNPIELIWGNCKGYYDKNIGRFNEQFNDEHVQLIWREALGRIDDKYWQKCIQHSEKCMMEWWQIEKKFDVVPPLIINLEDSSSNDSHEDDSISE